MIRPLVLFLPSWYPNRVTPTNGNFIRNHARVANRVAEVLVLYAQPDANCEQFEIQDTTFEGFREVIVYYPKASTKLSRYFCFFKYRWKGWRYLKKKTGKPQLIHVHVAFPAGVFALCLRFFCGVKYVVTEHWSGYLKKNITEMHWLHKFIFQHSTLNSAVSKHLMADIKELTGTKGWKTLPNLVLNTFFKKQETGDRSKTILHISNFNSLKNSLKIIQGLEVLLLENEEIKLLMIGENEGEKDACRQYVLANKKLNAKVHFEDVMEPAYIAALMRNATCLVSFSDYETQGITVLEALACGLPVVSSDIAPMNTYKLEGVVLAKTPEEICQQVRYFLAHPELADSLEMQEFAVKFSEESLILKFKKIYAEVL